MSRRRIPVISRILRRSDAREEAPTGTPQQAKPLKDSVWSGVLGREVVDGVEVVGVLVSSWRNDLVLIKKAFNDWSCQRKTALSESPPAPIVEVSKEELEQLEQKLSEAWSQRDEVEARIASVMRERDDAREERDELQQELTFLKKALDDQRLALDQRLEELKSAHQQSLTARDRILVQLKRRVVTLKKDMESAQEELAAAQTTIDRYRHLEAQFSWEVVRVAHDDTLRITDDVSHKEGILHESVDVDA